MRSRARGRPLALGEAVADLLELLHGLSRLAQQREPLAHPELRGGGGLARRVLHGDAPLGLHRLRQPSCLAVREARGVEGARDPFAPGVQALDAGELGEGVFELGRGLGAGEGQPAQVVIRPGRAVALREALGHLLEGLAGLLVVALHVEVVASDLEQGVVHGVRPREAGDDGVEVVEGLLGLPLATVGPAVLEQAPRLLLGRGLLPGPARRRRGRRRGRTAAGPTLSPSGPSRTRGNPPRPRPAPRA